MDLGLFVVGEAAKRGLVPRLPSGQQVMADAGTWLASEARDLIRSVRLDPDGEGAASLFVDVHPAAFPMRLHATVDGAVNAMAVTSAVGPGYHTYLSSARAAARHRDRGRLDEPGRRIRNDRDDALRRRR